MHTNKNNRSSKAMVRFLLLAAVVATVSTVTFGFFPGLIGGGSPFSNQVFAQNASTSSETNAISANSNENNQTIELGQPLPNPLTTNATILQGKIGSLQSPTQQLFAWSTSGDWQMKLDGPLIGRPNPHIESFNATVYMVRLDGNLLHKHQISNFTQNSVSHTGDAITTFNGTFTVTMREGTVHNVRGYIQIIGEMMNILIDPRELDNHFGSMPIYGMVLPSSEEIQTTH